MGSDLIMHSWINSSEPIVPTLISNHYSYFLVIFSFKRTFLWSQVVTFGLNVAEKSNSLFVHIDWWYNKWFVYFHLQIQSVWPSLPYCALRYSGKSAQRYQQWLVFHLNWWSMSSDHCDLLSILQFFDTFSTNGISLRQKQWSGKHALTDLLIVKFTCEQALVIIWTMQI